MSMPTLRHLSAASFAAAAGGDPWQVDDEIQAGDPGEISGLAEAFHQAGSHLKDADDHFNIAKKQFWDSWDRKDTVEHPINDSAEVQKVSAALGGQPDELAKIAVSLQQVAAALATAQRDSAALIEDLNADLHDIDDEIGEAMQELPFLAAELIGEAQQLTKAALDNIEAIRGAYIAQLHSAETAMMASGYAPGAIDESDATPGDAPREAAGQYEKSGQLAKDQATVEKASREHPNGHLGWSLDEIAADRRLDDFTSATDPANGAARYDGPQEQEEAARLAGSRLADFNLANSTGPVAKDPVLGGDMRDRAKARLTMQRQLMDAQLPWSNLPMSADDATRLMNQLAVQDRATALTRLQEQLQQQGISPEGAAAMVDGIGRGVMPQEYLDAAGAVSKVFDSGERAVDKFTELLPRGRHWQPGIAFTEADIRALAKLGDRFGAVGSVVELAVNVYDVTVNDASLVDVAGKAGGGLAGAWAFGEAGAMGGAAVAGPPGAFVGALVLGTAGAFVGEGVADKVMNWARN
ncbi:putative alpha/beta hydrolase [Mycolicibacterium mengxianglii]|uniref:putative alpha/beta hydrolase n=1 Tax=Mycolicibacterium mengxianglii TaxID=2736649 RepID=UPI0018EEE2C4|nr:hypothetical protein [Mycolicibacterium mengxianglii]